MPLTEHQLEALLRRLENDCACEPVWITDRWPDDETVIRPLRGKVRARHLLPCEHVVLRGLGRRVALDRWGEACNRLGRLKLAKLLHLTEERLAVLLERDGLTSLAKLLHTRRGKCRLEDRWDYLVRTQLPDERQQPRSRAEREAELVRRRLACLNLFCPDEFNNLPDGVMGQPVEDE